MKLAFSTLGCPEWTFDQALDNARGMGYQAIELRGVDGELRPDAIRAFRPENRPESLRKIREHGLTISDFGSSASFYEGNMEAALAEGHASVDLCAALGIPAVRVFGGRPAEGDTLEKQVRFVAEGVNALCEYAKPTGVEIWLEVHGWYNTAERILAVASQVRHDGFGIIWDVEHSDEADKGDFLSFYEPVKHLIRHVHVKDHKRLPDGAFRLCSVGEGDIPLREMVERLEKDGFGGCYSLEWEKKWHPELPAPEEEFPSYIKYMNGLAGRLKIR